MKKLLSLSILAATLASTAAFAVGNSHGNNGVGGNNGASASTALVVTNQTAPGLALSIAIVQAVINDLTGVGHNNHLKAVAFDIDQSNGHFNGVNVELAAVVKHEEANTFFEAVAAGAKLANDQLGSTASIVTIEGDKLEITAIGNVKGAQPATFVLALNSDNKGFNFAPAPLNKVVAAKLLSAQKGLNVSVKPAQLGR